MNIEKIKNELPIIKDMVEDNMHTEARARIAHIMGMPKQEKIFDTISTLQSSVGYLPLTLKEYRNEVEETMLAQIKAKHGEEIETLLKEAL